MADQIHLDGWSLKFSMLQAKQTACTAGGDVCRLMPRCRLLSLGGAHCANWHAGPHFPPVMRSLACTGQGCYMTVPVPFRARHHG